MQWTEELIGKISTPRLHLIDRAHLQQFAEAAHLNYPPYRDTGAAQKAGYADVLAAPTFAFTLTSGPIEGLELPGAGIIHGEQSFDYGVPIVAGDQISVSSTVVELKRRGPRIFLTLSTEGRNQHNEEVFRSTSLLIVAVPAEIPLAPTKEETLS